MIIYLDAVLLVNFIIDFLLLIGTNRICGHPLHLWKCAAAALIGSAYATVCMLPGFRFLGNALWRTVSLCIISSVAFGVSVDSLRRAVVFTLLSMAMGGISVGFEAKGTIGLLLAVGCLFALCLIGFRYRPGSVSFLPVELRHGKMRLHITALCDTGNTLRDPISGKSVLIVDSTVANKLTGLTREQLQNPVGVMRQAPISGLRLVPYKTVGQSDGMLLALHLPQVRIGKRVESTLVAFSPEKLSGDGTYQALTGGMA